MNFRIARQAGQQSLRFGLPLLASFSVLVPHLPARAYPEFQVSVNFPAPPSDQGGPKRTVGGGSRSDETCLTAGETITPVTVLAPINNQVSTVAADPTFYIYLPQTTAAAIELIISPVADSPNKDAARAHIHHEKVLPSELRQSLAEEPTLLKIAVENTGLEVGKSYEWSFSLLCTTTSVEHAAAIGGRIVRVEAPELPNDLSNVDPSDEEKTLALANAYAEAGIWVETVELVERLKDSQPEEWEGLLRSVIRPDRDRDMKSVKLDDVLRAPVQTLTIELE